LLRYLRAKIKSLIIKIKSLTSGVRLFY
jgi:hypothetical protein